MNLHFSQVALLTEGLTWQGHHGHQYQIEMCLYIEGKHENNSHIKIGEETIINLIKSGDLVHLQSHSISSTRLRKITLFQIGEINSSPLIEKRGILFDFL